LVYGISISIGSGNFYSLTSLTFLTPNFLRPLKGFFFIGFLDFFTSFIFYLFYYDVLKKFFVFWDLETSYIFLLLFYYKGFYRRRNFYEAAFLYFSGVYLIFNVLIF